MIVILVQDKVKLNKYLSMLVKVWPSELFARKDQIIPEVNSFVGSSHSELSRLSLISPLKAAF